MKILTIGEVSHNIDPNAWRSQVKREKKQYGKIQNHFIIGSIPWGIEWALKKTDHVADFFNFISLDYIFQNPANSGGITRFIYRKIKRKVKGLPSFDFISFNEDVLEKIAKFKPDLVYVIAGHYITGELLEKIKALGASVYLYTGVFPELLKDYVIESLPLYDGIFSPEKVGIKRFREEYSLDNMHYVSLACCPELHRKLTLSDEDAERYSSDVVFVGQYSPSRLELFERVADFASVKIFGTNWPESSNENLNISGPVWGEELAKAYNGAKIVVNIHQPWVIWGINYRTYEVAGCGIFQLVDDKPGLVEQFDIGKEIVTFKDEADLFDKMKYYLSHPEERADIAASAQRKVYEKYTWQGHLEKVIKVHNELN